MPIAVPCFCDQKVLKNWKVSVVITSDIPMTMVLVGKLGGSWWQCRLSHFRRVCRLCGVLMLVYIDMELVVMR